MACNDVDLPWIGAGVSVKCKINPLRVSHPRLIIFIQAPPQPID
jgi:hypothetical protein